MNTFSRLAIVICLFSLVSCGKKSSLERYPGSDYPKNYPAHNE